VSARLAAVASLTAAAAIAAGAFGAHGLADRLDAHQLELWQTASRYLALAGVGGLALAAGSAALLGGRGGSGRAGGWLVVAGGWLFALSLFALALGGPRLLGAVTPFGGVAMIAGFTTFALAALRVHEG
jgi:uncharacterized membrane protein YgdD (TMEM256/DUF423 family)